MDDVDVVNVLVGVIKLVLAEDVLETRVEVDFEVDVDVDDADMPLEDSEAVAAPATLIADTRTIELDV